MTSLLLPVILLVPLAAAVLIRLAHRHENLREAVTLTAGVSVFGLLLPLVPPVMRGETPAFFISELLPGLSLKLMLEPLGLLFALIAGFLWIVTSVYAIGYMRGHKEKNQTRFYVFFAVAISFALGIAFSGNLLTLFVFYEMLTLSTYPLVTHKGDEKAKQGGRIYLSILIGTSIAFFLPAMIATWHYGGTLDFQSGGILAGTAASPAVLGVLLLLFFFGTGKAALMPFHRWLPSAMVAPTPVSALLHAVAVVKAGVFTLLKIAVYIFGTDLLFSLEAREFLIYVAAAGVLLSSLVAMTKDNMKARLAYSTISQLGYVTLGALLATSAGIIGGSMHIAMHAFGKITLFFCAGAIMVAAHKTEISEMRGLGRIMPFTMGAFLVGTLSIIGLPPAGGTWSKYYLILGALDVKMQIVAVVLMVSSLLNIAYLLPIPVRGFFAPPDQRKRKIKEAPLPCLIAIGITALGCLLLFIFPAPLYSLAAMIR